MREGSTLVLMTKRTCICWNSHTSKQSAENDVLWSSITQSSGLSHHSEVKDPELLELISRLTSLLLQIEVSGYATSSEFI